MYESFWKLKEKPFQNTPDPKFFYYSSQHEDALIKLTYSITQNLCAAMLTGTFGCGKTLLGRMLSNSLDKNKYRAAFINNPDLEPADFLRSVLRGFKEINLSSNKNELSKDYCVEEINRVLVDNDRDGEDSVLIVDEAHSISDVKVFDEIRLLMNFQKESKNLITVILLGQNELRKKIDGFKPLDQRISVKCALKEF